MAFKTNKKLWNRLKQRNINAPIDTGIYKNTCDDWPKFYIGQTGRSVEVRFTEHVKEIGKHTTIFTKRKIGRNKIYSFIINP